MQDNEGVDLNKVLLEIGDDQEQLYYALGVTWADPPRLYMAKHEPGITARVAVNLLLDRIEARTIDWQLIRTFLAGCYGAIQSPTQMTLLCCLSDESKPAALTVMAWIIEAGCLRLHDFSDGGERFMRHVLRKRPQTIAKTLAARAA